MASVFVGATLALCLLLVPCFPYGNGPNNWEDVIECPSVITKNRLFACTIDTDAAGNNTINIKVEPVGGKSKGKALVSCTITPEWNYGDRTVLFLIKTSGLVTFKAAIGTGAEITKTWNVSNQTVFTRHKGVGKDLHLDAQVDAHRVVWEFHRYYPNSHFVVTGECYFKEYIGKIDLSTFMSHFTPMPVEAVTRGRHIYVPYLSMPIGTVLITARIWSGGAYRECTEHFEFKSDEGHLVVFEPLPFASRLPLTRNTDFTLDLSRIFSPHLTPESGFLGNPYKSMRFELSVKKCSPRNDPAIKAENKHCFKTYKEKSGKCWNKTDTKKNFYDARRSCQTGCNGELLRMYAIDKGTHTIADHVISKMHEKERQTDATGAFESCYYDMRTTPEKKLIHLDGSKPLKEFKSKITEGHFCAVFALDNRWTMSTNCETNNCYLCQSDPIPAGETIHTEIAGAAKLFVIRNDTLSKADGYDVSLIMTFDLGRVGRTPMVYQRTVVTRFTDIHRPTLEIRCIRNCVQNDWFLFNAREFKLQCPTCTYGDYRIEEACGKNLKSCARNRVYYSSKPDLLDRFVHVSNPNNTADRSEYRLMNGYPHIARRAPPKTDSNQLVVEPLGDGIFVIHYVFFKPSGEQQGLYPVYHHDLKWRFGTRSLTVPWLTTGQLVRSLPVNVVAVHGKEHKSVFHMPNLYYTLYKGMERVGTAPKHIVIKAQGYKYVEKPYVRLEIFLKAFERIYDDTRTHDEGEPYFGFRMTWLLLQGALDLGYIEGAFTFRKVMYNQFLKDAKRLNVRYNDAILILDALKVVMMDETGRIGLQSMETVRIMLHKVTNVVTSVVKDTPIDVKDKQCLILETLMMLRNRWLGAPLSNNFDGILQAVERHIVKRGAESQKCLGYDWVLQMHKHEIEPENGHVRTAISGGQHRYDLSTAISKEFLHKSLKHDPRGEDFVVGTVIFNMDEVLGTKPWVENSLQMGTTIIEHYRWFDQGAIKRIHYQDFLQIMYSVSTLVFGHKQARNTEEREEEDGDSKLKYVVEDAEVLSDCVWIVVTPCVTTFRKLSIKFYRSHDRMETFSVRFGKTESMRAIVDYRNSSVSKYYPNGDAEFNLEAVSKQSMYDHPDGKYLFEVEVIRLRGKKIYDGEFNATFDIEVLEFHCSYMSESGVVWELGVCTPINVTANNITCKCSRASGMFSLDVSKPTVTFNTVSYKYFLDAIDPDSRDTKPVALLTVLGLWIWFIAFGFTLKRQADLEQNTYRTHLVSLHFNPEDYYRFLLCVKTSAVPQSGTKARAWIVLIGNLRTSAEMLLDAHCTFSTRSEVWFLASCALNLGKLEAVIVKMDSGSSDETWRLNYVDVYDMQREVMTRMHSFHLFTKQNYWHFCSSHGQNQLTMYNNWVVDNIGFFLTKYHPVLAMFLRPPGEEKKHLHLIRLTSLFLWSFTLTILLVVGLPKYNFPDDRPKKTYAENVFIFAMFLQAMDKILLAILKRAFPNDRWKLLIRGRHLPEGRPVCPDTDHTQDPITYVHGKPTNLLNKYQRELKQDKLAESRLIDPTVSAFFSRLARKMTTKTSMTTRRSGAAYEDMDGWSSTTEGYIESEPEYKVVNTKPRPGHQWLDMILKGRESSDSSKQSSSMALEKSSSTPDTATIGSSGLSDEGPMPLTAHRSMKDGSKPSSSKVSFSRRAGVKYHFVDDDDDDDDDDDESVGESRRDNRNLNAGTTDRFETSVDTGVKSKTSTDSGVKSKSSTDSGVKSKSSTDPGVKSKSSTDSGVKSEIPAVSGVKLRISAVSVLNLRLSAVSGLNLKTSADSGIKVKTSDHLQRIRKTVFIKLATRVAKMTMNREQVASTRTSNFQDQMKESRDINLDGVCFVDLPIKAMIAHETWNNDPVMSGKNVIGKGIYSPKTPDRLYFEEALSHITEFTKSKTSTPEGDGDTFSMMRCSKETLIRNTTATFIGLYMVFCTIFICRTSLYQRDKEAMVTVVQALTFALIDIVILEPALLTVVGLVTSIVRGDLPSLVMARERANEANKVLQRLYQLQDANFASRVPYAAAWEYKGLGNNWYQTLIPNLQQGKAMAVAGSNAGRGLHLFLFLVCSIIIINVHSDVNGSYLLKRGVYNHLHLVDRTEGPAVVVDDLWRFLKDQHLPFMEAHNRVLTRFSRIRQVRFLQTKNLTHPCRRPQPVEGERPTCEQVMRGDVLESRDFCRDWYMYLNESTSHTKCYHFFKYSGRENDSFLDLAVDSYPDGWYGSILSKGLQDNLDLIEAMQDTNWIDEFTRAVVIETSLLDLMTGTAAAITVVFNFQTNGIKLNYQCQSFAFIFTYQSFVILYSALGIWAMLTIAEASTHISEISTVGIRGYLSDVGVVLKLVLVVFDILLLAGFAFRSHVTRGKYDLFIKAQFGTDGPVFISLADISFIVDKLNGISGFLALAAVMMIFENLSQLVRFHIFIKMIKNVFYMAATPFVFVVPISFLLYTRYGSQSHQLSDLITTFYTVVEYILKHKEIELRPSIMQSTIGVGMWIIFFIVITNGFLVNLNEQYSVLMLEKRCDTAKMKRRRRLTKGHSISYTSEESLEEYHADYRLLQSSSRGW